MDGNNDVNIVYTDGACNNVTKQGGWSYVILKDNNCIIKKCGSENNVTNNRMELKAVCEALKDCKELGFCGIQIMTDSSYVVNAMLYGNIDIWKKNNWRTKKRRKIRNRDLWELLVGMLDGNIDVRFVKVKAHSGEKYNTMVDHLAKGAIKDSYVYSRNNSK